MKIIYINVRNKWIKCILHHSNNLDLKAIAKSLNQYYINKEPCKVFFDRPNILFKSITPMRYVNHNRDAVIKEISTQDRDCCVEAHFYSHAALQQYLMDWLKGVENDV